MDTAIRWWLGSVHNEWPDNKYTGVTFYGNRVKAPWSNPDGARFIANQLRRCQFVGLGLSTIAPVPFSCGQIHVITAWGDDGDSGYYAEGTHPDSVKVADSDNELVLGAGNGDIRTYRYGDYDNRDPAFDQGHGWYLPDYDTYTVHPYVMNVTTLSENDSTTNEGTVKVLGSYKIWHDSTVAANDLHYRVGNEEQYEILGYQTKISWPSNSGPVVTPHGDPTYELEVDWNDLTVPIPPVHPSPITITTELVLPDSNAICYKRVFFTYDDTGGSRKPSFGWKLNTPGAPDLNAPYICGGYVVGAFDICEDASCMVVVGNHRFMHEYTWEQDPEQHRFVLESLGDTFYVKNLRFGHSYGYLDSAGLWGFDDWMTEYPACQRLGPDTLSVNLTWEGQLPYPPCVWPVGVTETRVFQGPSINTVAPNPFNPTTTIEYSTGVASVVVVAVYDTKGRLVARLVHESQEAGFHRVSWDGLNQKGVAVASGVYFVRLQSAGQAAARKIVLLK